MFGGRRIGLHAVSAASTAAGAWATAAGWETAVVPAAAQALALELFRLPRVRLGRAGLSDAVAFAAASLSGSLLTALALLESAAPAVGAAHFSAMLATLGFARLAGTPIAAPGERRALLLDSPSASFLRAALAGESRFEPLGWIALEPGGRDELVDGLPVLGALDELPYLAEWHEVESVVAVRPDRPELIDRLRTLAETAAVELILIPRPADLMRRTTVDSPAGAPDRHEPEPVGRLS